MKLADVHRDLADRESIVDMAMRIVVAVSFIFGGTVLILAISL